MAANRRISSNPLRSRTRLRTCPSSSFKRNSSQSESEILPLLATSTVENSRVENSRVEVSSDDFKDPYLGPAFELNEDPSWESTFAPYVLPPASHFDNVVMVQRGMLSFVESTWFQVLTGCVILVNLGVVVQDLVHPYAELWYLNQLLLGFYCLELVFRLGRFQCHYFDHPQDALWNWADLIIVIAGVLDQWILPLTPYGRSSDQRKGGITAFRAGRALRLFRLLRIVKLLRVIVKLDFTWTESSEFQTLVGVVIACNAALMGIETDMESPIFWWLEQATLSFFVFELAVRLKRDGWSFFYKPEDYAWNWIDFTIVLSGVMDLWILKLWASIHRHWSDSQESDNNSNGVGQLMMVARLLRLLRILRLLRLIKAVRPLYNLAMGIVRAMQSMFWVLVLTLVALYAFAILTTRVVGHASAASGIPAETRSLFGTVADSMFTLFSVMNSQGWKRVAPLLATVPWTKPIFVIFTIYSSWALLSVMTGVVSDNMFEVRKQQMKSDEMLNIERHVNLCTTLTEVFSAADRDGSGTLAREEYNQLLRSSYHKQKIQRITNIPIKDLPMVFDWLDVDKTGIVSFAEFIHAFDLLNEEDPGGKGLLRVEFLMKQRAFALEQQLDSLSQEVSSIEREQEDMARDLLRKLRTALEAGYKQPSSDV